jgi:hypothetical protein
MSAIRNSPHAADGSLQRLVYRHRRAQAALAAARALCEALHELPHATTLRRFHARREVEEAQRYVADLQSDLERAGPVTAGHCAAA